MLAAIWAALFGRGGGARDCDRCGATHRRDDDLCARCADTARRMNTWMPR